MGPRIGLRLLPRPDQHGLARLQLADEDAAVRTLDDRRDRSLLLHADVTAWKCMLGYATLA